MKIENKKIDKINRAAYNPRVELKPGDDDYESIKYSLEKYGLLQPIVWNSRTNNVVAGHQRLNIMQAAGVTETEVSVVDLDPIAERQLNVVLNRVRGRWDDSKLYSLLDQLGEDAKHTGFTEEELEVLKESAHYFDDPQPDPIESGDFFLVTVLFDQSDKKEIKKYIKNNGDEKIIRAIVNTAKGEA